MKMQVSEIAKVVNAQNDITKWATLEVTSVGYDTRQLTTGALFVPLMGQRDGHDYQVMAQQQGAVISFWQADHEVPVDMPVIVVADTLKAYQQLARYYLQKVNPFVVAITGSNGKTTTKDMAAAILAKSFNVFKTPENYNNEIGVPQTILAMPMNTEMLVVEMGMDRPGQIADLTTIANPDVAVITMIGEAHIEFFKTRDKIADAKMEIASHLNPDGVLIFDGDEPLLNERTQDLQMTKKTFGQKETNTLYPTMIATDQLKTRFQLNRWPELTFEIPLMGDYNVKNALAAICIGQYLKITPEMMQQALANFQMTENRTQWLTANNGAQILSDVYNSNPTAAKEVLKNFADFQTTGKRQVVLGDMLELGSASQELHLSLEKALDPKKIQVVYLIGSEIKPLYEALVNIYPQSQLHYYTTSQQAELLNDIYQNLNENDLLLLKASHGIHLENIVANLISEK